MIDHTYIHPSYIHTHASAHFTHTQTQCTLSVAASLFCFVYTFHIQAYTMVGEPHYMAPEQISGRGYGYGVDYWSLGILIFVMLHVETPFAKQTSETQVPYGMVFLLSDRSGEKHITPYL